MALQCFEPSLHLYQFKRHSKQKVDKRFIAIIIIIMINNTHTHTQSHRVVRHEQAHFLLVHLEIDPKKKKNITIWRVDTQTTPTTLHQQNKTKKKHTSQPFSLLFLSPPLLLFLSLLLFLFLPLPLLSLTIFGNEMEYCDKNSRPAIQQTKTEHTDLNMPNLKLWCVLWLC